MRSIDLKYLLAYVGPLLVFLGIYLGGIWSYSAFVFAFLLVPAGELFLPVRDQVVELNGNDRGIHPFFDWLLYLNLPVVYGMIVSLLWRVTQTPVVPYEVIGMALSTGIFLGASGINVAHELGHRKHKGEQWMAKLLLLPALYQHFFVEHNRGHHRYVATREDPATARYGETLYHFWIRSTAGSIKSAWRLERFRLEKLNLNVFSRHNQMLQFAFMQIVYLSGVFFFFGGQGLLLAVTVAMIGFLLLESINYIEHYGLLRQKNQAGVYEKVGMKHSWNSNHDLGRILLYELTRHADHHYKASKKYQLLRHVDESPQLPAGYPGSIILAMLPPLWFKIMNKRVPLEMLDSAQV